MQCLHPQEAYIHLNDKGVYEGKPVFNKPLFKSKFEEKDWLGYYTDVVKIGCGYCSCCVARKRASVDIRLKAELVNCAKESSSFITLTYDDIHLPINRGLNYPDISNFIASVRHWLARNRPDVKFTWCRAGEFGSKTKRPHYHLIFFGLNVLEETCFGPNTVQASNLYNSSFVAHFWPFGYNWTAVARPSCCSYVCGYTIKKLVRSEDEYRNDLLISDFCTKYRKRSYLDYYDIRLKDCDLDVSLLSTQLKKYVKEKYYKIGYKDAYNRWRTRRIVNYQFPLGRCYHLGDFYYPQEQVRVSKNMGLDYFKNNLESVKLGYISDPFDINIKRTLPISYLNYLKNNFEGLYLDYKRSSIAHSKELNLIDTSRKDVEQIFTNFSYTERPLDEENAPLDEAEISLFDIDI